MDSMTGIPVVQYTFKRSDQVTTIQSKSSEDVDEQSIHVDIVLLFQSRIANDDSLTHHSSGVLLGLPTLLHFFLSLGMVIDSL